MALKTKEERAAYWRDWMAKHPEMRKRHNAQARARRRAAKGETGLATCQYPRSLGDPEIPTEKHVVLARLLRRLLLEAFERGYLDHDEAGYDMRIKAALSVSECLVKTVEEPDGSHDTGG